MRTLLINKIFMFACPEWGLVFLHLAVWISVWVKGVEAKESLGIPEKRKKQSETSEKERGRSFGHLWPSQPRHKS